MIFSNIYPIILNSSVKNELKKYFGRTEIKEIIAKTKVGYKRMIKNNPNIKIGKYGFEKSCIDIYSINLYANIEQEISHEVHNKIYDNILKGCKILTIKNRITNLLNQKIRKNIYKNIM